MQTQPFSYNITYRSLLVLFVFLLITFYMTPYQRGFNCSDKSIQNQYLPLIFPTRWLFFCTLLVPMAVIGLVQHFGPKGNSPHLTLASKLTKFCFGFMINLTLTELTKKCFGRLRPHTYTFCNLDKLCPMGPVDQYIESFVCNNPNASPMYITNTRLSFYSGHSSLGSFAGTYLVCYLHETLFAHFAHFNALQKTLVILTDLCIFVMYLYPGYTQWLIYWHFITDVLTGFTAGIFYALVVFNTVNRALPSHSAKCTSIN